MHTNGAGCSSAYDVLARPLMSQGGVQGEMSEKRLEKLRQEIEQLAGPSCGGRVHAEEGRRKLAEQVATNEQQLEALKREALQQELRQQDLQHQLSQVQQQLSQGHDHVREKRDQLLQQQAAHRQQMQTQMQQLYGEAQQYNEHYASAAKQQQVQSGVLQQVVQCFTQAHLTLTAWTQREASQGRRLPQGCENAARLVESVLTGGEAPTKLTQPPPMRVPGSQGVSGGSPRMVALTQAAWIHLGPKLHGESAAALAADVAMQVDDGPRWEDDPDLSFKSADLSFQSFASADFDALAAVGGSPLLNGFTRGGDSKKGAPHGAHAGFSRASSSVLVAAASGEGPAGGEGAASSDSTEPISPLFHLGTLLSTPELDDWYRQLAPAAKQQLMSASNGASPTIAANGWGARTDGGADPLAPSALDETIQWNAAMVQTAACLGAPRVPFKRRKGGSSLASKPPTLQQAYETNFVPGGSGW